MKCEEFKFEYTATPNEIAGATCEHLQSCDACQQFVEEQKEFEQLLSISLNDAAPEGLRHSLREQAMAQPSTNKMNGWPMAIAASVLLTVGVLTMNFQPQSQGDLPLERLIVEHFAHDGVEAIQASHRLAVHELNQIEDGFGVRLKTPDQVRYAERCPIGDSYGLHMVTQYRGKPVTVIYMPEITPDAYQPFHYSGMKGWVKPLPQGGSVAFLSGERSELPEQSYSEEVFEWL